MNTFVRTILAFTSLAATALAAGFPPGTAYVGLESGIRSIDLATGVTSAPLPALQNSLVVSLSFGPDGKLYASLPLEKRVAILDSTGKEVGSIAIPKQPMGVEFGADGSLFVATQFNRVYVYAPDGTYTYDFAAGSNGDLLYALTIGPNGHVHAVLSNTSKLNEIDPTGVILQTYYLSGIGCQTPTVLTPAPGGRFYTARNDGTKVFLISSTGGVYASGLLPDLGLVSDIAARGDGRVYLACDDGITVVDAQTLALVETLPIPGTLTFSIAFAPHRFTAKLKGRLLQDGKAHAVNESVVLSLTPGLPTIQLQFKDASSAPDTQMNAFGSPYLVLHGFESVGFGKKRMLHGASAPELAELAGVGSFMLDVGGAVDKATGAFKPKTAKGTIHRAAGTGLFRGQLVTSGALK